MFAFPVFVYLILGSIHRYIAGDIVYTSFATVLSYVIGILNFPACYITCGLAAACVVKYNIKNSFAIVCAAYISLSIPFLCRVIIEGIFSSYFSYYIGTYLLEAGINYLINAVIFTVIIVYCIFKSKKKPLGSKKKNPLFGAFVLAAILWFTAGFVQELYYTIAFIYALMYEYYSAITFNELISIITNYTILIVTAISGYIIMRFTAHIAKISFTNE